MFKLLGRKAMTNQDSILKSRDSTLPTRVRVEISSGGRDAMGVGLSGRRKMC